MTTATLRQVSRLNRGMRRETALLHRQYLSLKSSVNEINRDLTRLEREVEDIDINDVIGDLGKLQDDVHGLQSQVDDLERYGDA